MKTIHFNKDVALGRQHFEDLEELEDYLYALRIKAEIPEGHKQLLDERLNELENRAEKGSTWEELKVKMVSRK